MILNIMKSVGKTLRKNLSILEVKDLGECVRKSKQANVSSLYFPPKPGFKKQNDFRSLYHGSVSHGFCKYCSDRLQKVFLTALLILGTRSKLEGWIEIRKGLFRVLPKECHQICSLPLRNIKASLLCWACSDCI